MRRGSHVSLPHAGEKLDKTAITKSQGDDDGRGLNISSSQIDQTENESGQGESGQAERSRVGEFTSFDALVETRLKFTTKS